MARAPKPISMQSSHLTKEEIEKRVQAEKKIKGRNNKVYKPPKDIPEPVKKIYKTLVTELKEADILNNLDIELLVTTSYAIYRMRKARSYMDKHGEIERGPKGNNVKCPYVQIEKDYQAIFHTGCLQLGLSPSSRAKIALLAAEQNDKSEEDEVFD